MEGHQLASSARSQTAAVGRHWEATARRALDITVSALILLFCLPLIAIVAVAIALDSRGPVIFHQRRLGSQLNPFTVHKFRTMRAESDPAPHRRYIKDLIRNPQPTSGGLFKLTDDQRVTRVGRVLRRLSLDELPQLWNVLRGDMSLVGPRPVIPYETEDYEAWYMDRFAVKPGLTGLWQVSGRNERTYVEMVRLDVEYVARRSLVLDLVILVKTPWAVLRSRGAA